METFGARFFSAKTYRYFEAALLACAVFILIIASTYRLSESPAIWYDEGFYTQMGMNVAHAGQQALQVAPGKYVHNSYVSVGYPLIYPLAASYSLFGDGVVQGRAVMVAYIVLFAAASYFLVRRVFGSWAASWSLLLLATFPMLYGNGKSVLGEVPGLFFFIATLLSLSWLEEGGYRDWRGYILTGACAGLCVATKPLFLLLLPALFFTLVVKWKKITLSRSGFALGAVAFAVPMLLWVYTQIGPDVSLHSLLADYANPYSAQDLPALIIQNLERFFTESTPMYTAFMLAVWTLSLWLRRKNKNISAAELTAFFFCLLIVASYVRLPGWYRYLFPATILALVFFPPVFCKVFDRLKERTEFLKDVFWLPYAFVLLLSAGQLYQTAHSSYVAGYYNSTKVEDIAAAFSKLNPGASFFLYDTPELAVLLPSRNYYQYLSPLPSVTVGGQELGVIQKGVPDFILINTEDPHERDFARYRLLEKVNHYDILERNP